MPAHPRAGGENTYQNVTDAATDGSSPRGRGKHKLIATLVKPWGLIPARAGKTWELNTGTTRIWAHPRAGGENCLKHFFSHVPGGSSPRGRGKR